jgi:nucleoside-diphosphate-sugar epimerase
MRIAVTGASGFCGGYVARRLATAGVDVVGLGRRPAQVGEHRPWDAAVEAPDLSGVDGVIHLAATVGDPRPGTSETDFVRVNVDGTARLLDAAGGRPVVWLSSSSVYDPRHDRSLVTESHPTDGGHLNAYGRTKAAGDRLALDAGAVVVRPRAVYGEGDHHLLPRLVAAVRRGRVGVPGDDVRLSLTHVDNLATACVAALGWAPGAYNVADPTAYQRDDVLREVLAAACGREIGVRHLPVRFANALADAATAAARVTGREPLLTRYAVDQLSNPFVLDVTRARAAGWEPTATLAAYVAWLRARTAGAR